jgi:polyferredoxin
LGTRPRVAVYASLLLAFSALGAWTLTDRSLLLIDVLRDRSALLRETSDGRIENAYTLKLMNLDNAPRQFEVGVSGMPGIEIVGERRFDVAPGAIRPLSITVSAPVQNDLRGFQPISFQVVPTHDPESSVLERSSFALP